MKLNNNNDRWIEKAKEIATHAHAGQFRRDGTTPYITHPEAVAASVEDRLKPIAYLHDVPEDTETTIEDLKREGFPDYIIAAVTLLTHKDGQSNMKYWHEILTNADAVKVKIADIKHNLSCNPSEHAKEKYARALTLFAEYGYSV